MTVNDIPWILLYVIFWWIGVHAPSRSMIQKKEGTLLISRDSVTYHSVLYPSGCIIYGECLNWEAKWSPLHCRILLVFYVNRILSGNRQLEYWVGGVLVLVLLAFICIAGSCVGVDGGEFWRSLWFLWTWGPTAQGVMKSVLFCDICCDASELRSDLICGCLYRNGCCCRGNCQLRISPNPGITPSWLSDESAPSKCVWRPRFDP
jgi:hypothetical protein